MTIKLEYKGKTYNTTIGGQGELIIQTNPFSILLEPEKSFRNIVRELFLNLFYRKKKKYWKHEEDIPLSKVLDKTIIPPFEEKGYKVNIKTIEIKGREIYINGKHLEDYIVNCSR